MRKNVINTYEKYGINLQDAIDLVKSIPVSLHVWQGDDIQGLIKENKAELSGGIQVTGNYPGKANNFIQLKSDIDMALSNIPGLKRINLHAIYAVSDTFIDRDEISTEHFDPWLDFAMEKDLKLDFNPTFFSHNKVVNNLTLSSPNREIRDFWIEHGRRARKISAYIGKTQGDACLCNIWIPDGMKDVPADRYGPRIRLKESLDDIYKTEYSKEHIIDSLESKVFGIGLESYTVGSSEFYLNYAKENGINALIDNGHFHPTENVADKLSSLLLFNDYVALHITRSVRWDSDHVILLDDTLKEITKEILSSNNVHRFKIGLDFFDATVNRVVAWIVGARNVQKALLLGALYPHELLRELQDLGDFTKLMVIQEEIKTLPFREVWDEYCQQNNVPLDGDWLGDILEYESNILKERL